MAIQKFFGTVDSYALGIGFGARHNFRNAFIAASAALLALTSVTPTTQAATITSVFSTGVNSSGNALPDGTVGDPHYILFSVPGGTTDIRVRTDVGGFPIPPYIGGSSSAAWIGPNNDSSIDGPVGPYDYRTTFNLTGFNFLTASITGAWSSDNESIRILLNGVDTLIPGSPDDTPFSKTPVNFTISAGFFAGSNTLDFIVNNDGGPTGLLVELAGTASVSATPLPAAVWLFGSVIAGGAGMSRWRKGRVKALAA